MATTKRKVRERVVEMLDDIRPHLEKKLDELLKSDFIDFEKEDDFVVPAEVVDANEDEQAVIDYVAGVEYEITPNNQR